LVNRARASGQTLGVQRIDGEAALASPLAALLQEAGFVATPRALRLRT
jgi:ATP-dependent Lhr-like helicase